jgi:hypothetical protein
MFIVDEFLAVMLQSAPDFKKSLAPLEMARLDVW